MQQEGLITYPGFIFVPLAANALSKNEFSYLSQSASSADDFLLLRDLRASVVNFLTGSEVGFREINHNLRP